MTALQLEGEAFREGWNAAIRAVCATLKEDASADLARIPRSKVAHVWESMEYAQSRARELFKGENP